jgi:hypothetical protein
VKLLRYGECINDLLTVHHSTSVQRNQRDPFSIQFIKNEWPLHVSNITCLSSRGATQAALGILRACYVSWLITRIGVELTSKTQNTKCRWWSAS